MTILSENCVQQLSRVDIPGRVGRIFREDAHVDYYGHRPRSLSRRTRARASASQRVGAPVFTTKHARRRKLSPTDRSATRRGVDVGVCGREERQSFEQKRGVNREGNPLFVRQFRYKPRTRPSLNSATSETLVSVLNEMREVDSSLEQLLVETNRSPRSGAYTAGNEASSSTVYYDETSTTTKKTEKGKKNRRKERLAMDSSSSSSSSESSGSSDEERGTERVSTSGSKTRGKIKVKSIAKNTSGKGSKFRILENSVVTAPESTLPSTSGLEPFEETSTERTVFVCQGKGCSKRGGAEVLSAVLEEGSRQGFGVVECKCMGRCKFGPVMVETLNSSPEGEVEHTAVDPAGVSEILKEKRSPEKLQCCS